MYSLNAHGQLISLDTPKVMGIINATPDSFFGESRKENTADIVATAGKMINDGAAILDIGGMSSRPGAEEISVEQEIERVVPAIESILKEHPDTLISIDTYRSEVAKAAIHAGAKIINDISGGEIDNKILAVAAADDIPYICMHMKGTPQNMQNNPTYTNVVLEVFKNLQKKIVRCRKAGIKDVIIDLGFGFGKTLKHNYQLLREMDYFQQLDCPILAGLSRKSMLYKPLGITPEESLNVTTAAHMIALQNGANILRVHDVKEAVECVKVWALNKEGLSLV